MFKDRWLDFRDRLLASPGFRSWAAANPFTRPIARKRARALFDLCAGFVYSQVLLACVRLDLFESLHEKPQTAAELAARTGVPEEGLTRLLKAAVSLDLAENRGAARFGLGPLGASMIGNPGIAAMVEHHSLLYGDLHDPLALLADRSKDTALSRYWAYARSDQPGAVDSQAVSGYSALMAASQSFIAEEVLAAYPVGRHKRLLDMGGGEGAFLKAVAETNPGLALMLFDLPPVAERARARFEALGLGNRLTVHGGDFFSDSLPDGADLISLVRILHDHEDEAVVTILQAARRALPQDGTLLVAEPMAGTRNAEPIGDAYFGLYLWAMGSGRPRTLEELTHLLKQTGFAEIRAIYTRMPMLVRVVTARVR